MHNKKMINKGAVNHTKTNNPKTGTENLHQKRINYPGRKSSACQTE